MSDMTRVLEAVRKAMPNEYDAVVVKRAITAIQEARTTLMLDATFYGALAVRMKLIPHRVKSQGTAATDGRAIYFNPDWIVELRHRQLVGLIAHETMHVAHKHTLRREGRDHRTWNIACDYAINSELLEAGFELPEDGCVNRRYKGWAAEEVYREIYKPPPPPPPIDDPKCVIGTPGKGKGDEDSPKPDVILPNDDEDHDDEEEVPEDDGTADDEDSPEDDGDVPQDGGAEETSEEDEDSETGGGAGEDEESEPEEPMPAGGVLDSPDPVEDSSEIDIAIVEAAMCAKAAGNLPGHVQRLINKLTPKHDVAWQDELAEFLEKNMREDYSMAKPSRRYLSAGVYLPSLVSQAHPELAFLIDTSGSINQTQLSRAVQRLEECCEQVRPERVHIKAGDTRERWSAVRERGEALDVQAPGGGGTQFGWGFENLADEGVEPACAVYFSADCDGYFGEEPPYPVLWIAEKGHRKPPWGRVIVMDDAREE